MKTFQLVVDVRATDEFGDAPAFAAIEVTPEFLARLCELSELCKRYALESVNVSSGQVTWQRSDEFRITGDSLRVYGEDFWFEAYPKHAYYQIETAAVCIPDLIKAAGDGDEGTQGGFYGDLEFHDGILFGGGYPSDLVEIYQDAMEKEEAV